MPYSRTRATLLLSALTAVILLLAIIEGWYGRMFYSMDSMGYLDSAIALRAGDWKTALSPYWGFSYSLLIALFRPLFGQDALGEWLTTRTLNLFILLFDWLSFLYLLQGIAGGRARDDRSRSYLLLTAFCIFVPYEICVGNSSRVSADPLVTGLVFLALGLLLRLPTRASVWNSLALGLVLGFGYVTKAIFLPFSAVILAILVVALLVRRQSLRYLLPVCAGFALLAVPYASAISWAFGRVTFGESGPLNYAWNVNGLLMSVHWQGGPTQLGTPLHPTRLLMEKPAVFEFARPFAVTYPPFYNPPYWYEGYRHVFSPKAQALALARNAKRLLGALARRPLTFFSLAALLVLWRTVDRRRLWLLWLRSLWPAWAAALLLLAIYMPVFVEERYIAPALAILTVIPFLYLCKPDTATPNGRTLVLAFLTLGVFTDVAITQRITLARLAHGDSFTASDQWKLGKGLGQSGLHPGDAIAALDGPMYLCEWAHVAGLRIVSELGKEGDAAVFWSSGEAEQRQVLEAFRHSGAIAVVALAKPPDAQSTGWQPIAGTQSWLLNLKPDNTHLSVLR